MSKEISLIADDGTEVTFVDDGEPVSGAMKKVYFSPDRTYVVAFFKDPLDRQGEQRLKLLTSSYREKIFTNEKADYWKDYFCWPTKTVEWNGLKGIVCPCYSSKYYFADGKFKGKEKEGKWFASAKLMNKFLSSAQKGTWMHRIKMCIQMARAVRKLHALGLAHSDLSYKNILVDPETGSATMIDIDGLVVPGKFPPDVEGTPDFIAPEVLETKDLPKDDPKKILPSRLTDLHALAVLIYMYLLNRHPLKGGKQHSKDVEEDDRLMMGREALFIENPRDTSNRPNINDLEPSSLPQADVTKRPYTMCGPYLTELFNKAFVLGLHNPKLRPTASQWEEALIKTVDLLFKCSNPKCEEKYFVFDKSRTPVCPFCGQKHNAHQPIMNLYYSPKGDGHFVNENHRVVIYDGLPLFSWQTDRGIAPNENIREEDKPSVADCQIYLGKWVLINRILTDLNWIDDKGQKHNVPKGKFIELNEGTKLLFGSSSTSRLAIIQIL